MKRLLHFTGYYPTTGVQLQDEGLIKLLHEAYIPECEI